MKILIVDDQAKHRDLLEAILTKWPEQQVTAVESGQTALSWLEAPEQRFDLVFLDANMPGISGREVLAHIQNSPRHRELGIILCTSSSDRPALGAAGELGTDHTLPKPCTAEGIAQKLRHFGAIPHAPSN